MKRVEFITQKRTIPIDPNRKKIILIGKDAGITAEDFRRLEGGVIICNDVNQIRVIYFDDAKIMAETSGGWYE